jgi:hypothetical protein
MIVRRNWLALCLALPLALSAAAAGAQTGPSWKPTAYDAMGPLKTIREAGSAACTIFRPQVLEGKSPIVLWGNGTGQQPGIYQPILKTLATNGFVVAAANTPNAGDGRDMLGCLDWLTAENARPDSPYFGKLDLTKVGASGHSQGGGGAIMAGRDPRVVATAPVMPYTIGLRYENGAHRRLNGPVLVLSGEADATARPEPNQRLVFDGANQPAVWATLARAGHLAPMGPGVFPGIINAWFRWRLMGDVQAGAMFQGERCGYCVSPDWTVRKKGIP